jgi:hypothetical protein
MAWGDYREFLAALEKAGELRNRDQATGRTGTATIAAKVIFLDFVWSLSAVGTGRHGGFIRWARKAGTLLDAKER